MNSHEFTNIDKKGQEIVFIKKKTVSFNEKVEVLVPAEIKIINVKKVTFNKRVKVFPIPIKEDFGNIAHDLWYSRKELARIIFKYAG